METSTQRARRVVEEAQALDPHRPVLREAVLEHADLRGPDLALRPCATPASITVTCAA
jgi:hypothetical protein